MKAVMHGAAAIMCGTADIVIAGGMESMSNSPFYLPKARTGLRYGHGQILDAIQLDGLTDAGTGLSMGTCAEQLASEMGISRADQDDYGLESYRRAQHATQTGIFASEIAPVTISKKSKSSSASSSASTSASTVISADEECLKPLDESKFRSVPPAFPPPGHPGTVTAANASPISDGAAAIVLISGDKARLLGLSTLARLRGWSDAERDAAHFSIAPSLAIPRALRHAGITADHVDLYEINEAFSVVAVANARLLGLDAARVNVNGGAVAMGHPLGCSGARIIVTLAAELARRGGVGVAAVCNGGGGASAVVIEAMSRPEAV